MARKCKIGLDYFSHDVNMRSDSKIRFIKAKHGFIAYGIYNALLEEIYMNGYYIKNGEKFNILFSDENKIDLNVFKNVLNDCIEEGLFDKNIYLKYAILTSSRIQLNYLAVAERRKNVEFYKEYLLIDPENEKSEKIKLNVNILTLNVNINEENADIGTQRKEKERKEKERKEKDDEEKSPTHKKIDKNENKIYVDLGENYKVVKLTQEEIDKLKEKLGIEKTKEYIERLNLYVGSTGKKYVSHYMTILNWYNKDKGG